MTQRKIALSIEEAADYTGCLLYTSGDCPARPYRAAWYDSQL